MPLITVILVILVVGALVALINKYGPEYVSPGFIRLVNIVAIVFTIIWLMKVIGVWEYLTTVTVGK